MNPLTIALASMLAAPPVITVDRDNVQIDRSCIVEIRADLIEDADQNGVIHIVADDITVEFSDDHRELIQVAEGTPWNEIDGIGIRIDGHSNVRLKNAHVHRFKVGIYASNADGLTLEGCDVAGGFMQHLESTPKAEAVSDWLRPHNNDNNEWMNKYGAGICVEESSDVTIHGCFARRRQNGIILDTVTDSKVYDNDCSFLSGWGLAMWRSSSNVVSRNAFDFCIRGYSHGVYNRGQDSAGILMFEQCTDNVIAENSATHCGDGIFAFAGQEALGESDPREDSSWYEGRGNNDNLFVGNDLSYAAAHGLELTFSFANRIVSNTMIGNAICGIWGGYSQNTLIANNTFIENGDNGYGMERGGINIEHGHGNVIRGNDFRKNQCGIFLWWDADEGLMNTPWAKANEKGSSANVIVNNLFDHDAVAIQLRETDDTTLRDNIFENVNRERDADTQSNEGVSNQDPPQTNLEVPETYPVYGEIDPIEAGAGLAGRDRIIMTEWGPYDWQSPHLLQVPHPNRGHMYRLLGDQPLLDVKREGGVRLAPKVDEEGQRVLVMPIVFGAVTPYELIVSAGEETLRVSNVLHSYRWEVQYFPYDPEQADPRDDVDAWREQRLVGGIRENRNSLDLTFGGNGPSQLPDASEAVRGADLPADHFGTIAGTWLNVPPGTWRISTRSDDGIRMWVNDKLVIDDWTWHAPKTHEHTFKLQRQERLDIRIEHFELDGHAVLSFDIEPVRE